METKPKNLVQKLCEIMAAVGYTQKTGWNEAQRYHYVTEADIAEKIRPELAKRNIFIFPTLVKTERSKLERISFKGEVKTSYATDLVMRWTIVDGDTGEERVCEIPGCSESPGDKGVYVAMTGSEKYLLVKGFLLPTGDDPEDDANEPTGAAKERATREAQDVAEAKIAIHAQKKGRTPPNGSNSVPALFYKWHDESQTAEIDGDADLKQANRALLVPLWNATSKTIVANADQLEVLKYEFDKRGVQFRPLKTL